MNSRLEAFRKALGEKRALKVIAGIANFDSDRVLAVVRAASAAGAHAVDVAATPAIVSAVRQATDLTVFASSINPIELAQAVEAGADAVEIGNYDALYAQGLFLTHEDVLKLTEETVKLVGGKALISVTIPGHLSLDTQIRMAEKLEAMGVDVIQTEGASRVVCAEPRIKDLCANEKAELTLNNTRVLAQHTSLPVMSASGITLENLSQCFDNGASAIGVGSTVNKLASEVEMTQLLQRMMVKITTINLSEELASINAHNLCATAS